MIRVANAPSRSLSRSPAAAAFVPLLLAVVLSVPFAMRPDLETDLLRSVAPPRESSRESSEAFSSRPELIESIFFRGKGGRDVLDSSVLLDAWRLMDEVAAISVSESGDEGKNSSGQLWGLSDLCVRAGEECFRLSVLDYWESADEMSRDVMPRTTVRRDHPFRPRELILGGMELNDWEVARAEAAMISIFIYRVDKGLVKRWEAQLRAACSRANSRENSTIDVHVLTSFGVEESMSEGIFAGIILSLIAFILLACVLAFTIGHQSFSLAASSVLATFGLTLIGAAVLASFALMQLFGNKMTPFAVQAIPMLLLGIGVDYLVMMCHCVDKAATSTIKGEVGIGSQVVAAELVNKSRGKKVEKVDVAAALGDSGVAIAASATSIAGGCLAAAAAAACSDLTFVRNVLLQLCVGISLVACFMIVSFPAGAVLLRRFFPACSRARDHCTAVDGGNVEPGPASKYCRYVTQLVARFVRSTAQRALSGWFKYAISAAAVTVVLSTFFAAPTLTADMSMYDLLGRGSAFSGFMSEATTFFSMPMPIELKQVGGNFSAAATRAEYKRTMARVAELASTHPLQLQHHWLNDMITWIAFFSPHRREYREAGYVIPDDAFPAWLEEFSRHPLMNGHREDVALRQVPLLSQTPDYNASLGLEVVACRTKGFAMGSDARVTTVSAVLREIRAVLRESWLPITVEMQNAQGLDELFATLPRSVKPVTAAAGFGSVVVILAFLASQGCRRGLHRPRNDRSTSGFKGESGGHPTARGGIGGDSSDGRGSWWSEMTSTSSLEALFAATLAIASAACTLRWIMGVHAQDFQLHPFSFIYTVVVVILTAEFTTHLLVRVVYEMRRLDVEEGTEMQEVAINSVSETAAVEAENKVRDDVGAGGAGEDRDAGSSFVVPSAISPRGRRDAVEIASDKVDATLMALAAVGPQVRSLGKQYEHVEYFDSFFLALRPFKRFQARQHLCVTLCKISAV